MTKTTPTTTTTTTTTTDSTIDASVNPAAKATEKEATKASKGASAGGRRRRNVPGLVLAGGLVALAVAVALGATFKSNASFAEEYLARQLGEQRITFTEASAMTPQDREHPCLVKYAGQMLITGEQAECYANQFIGRHLKSVAGGKTYSEMRAVQNDLRAKIAAAQAANDPSVPDLQRQLAEATAKRQSLLEGESMRGLLLTSYGFSTLGSKAGQAAGAANVAGAAALGVAVVVAAAISVRSRRRAAAGSSVV